MIQNSVAAAAEAATATALLYIVPMNSSNEI